jgi:hypothetical protein
MATSTSGSRRSGSDCCCRRDHRRLVCLGITPLGRGEVAAPKRRAARAVAPLSFRRKAEAPVDDLGCCLELPGGLGASDRFHETAARSRRLLRDLAIARGVPPFSAPEPHFPRLTTGSVQVSSKTGELHLGAGVPSVGTAGRAPATSRCEGQAGVASYCPAPSIPRCCVSSPCRPALPCRPIFPCAFPYGRAAAHADDHRMRPVDRARDVRVLVAQ